MMNDTKLFQDDSKELKTGQHALSVILSKVKENVISPNRLLSKPAVAIHIRQMLA